MEASFYVVPERTSLKQVAERLYEGRSELLKNDFLRFNSGAEPVEGLLLQGQILYIPEPVCFAEEEDVMDLISDMNSIVTQAMTTDERRSFSQHAAMVQNAVTSKEIDITGYAASANTFASSIVGGLAIHNQQVKAILQEFERKYLNSIKANGKLGPEFYSYRRQVFQSLDSVVTRTANKVSGFDYKGDIKSHINIKNKSEILRIKKLGTSSTSDLKALRPHFEQLARANKWLTRGSYLTIGLNAYLTYDSVETLCNNSSQDACYKERSVKYTGAAASTAGGILGGGAAAYATCNLLFGIETAGTSLLWCGLVAGAVGGYAGGKVGEAGGEKIGNIIYEKKYKK
ncbi:hypothetical protein ACKC9G_14515 [Pokkaliibacter sp. CJK22405]|uniref:hypothetical protein n=1 Tax=Pokkaliibacter sp. CJK22405 TaxID=3384615 RepID=UPI00398467C9